MKMIIIKEIKREKKTKTHPDIQTRLKPSLALNSSRPEHKAWRANSIEQRKSVLRKPSGVAIPEGYRRVMFARQTRADIHADNFRGQTSYIAVSFESASANENVFYLQVCL